MRHLEVELRMGGHRAAGRDVGDADLRTPAGVSRASYTMPGYGEEARVRDPYWATTWCCPARSRARTRRCENAPPYPETRDTTFAPTAIAAGAMIVRRAKMTG